VKMVELFMNFLFCDASYSKYMSTEILCMYVCIALVRKFAEIAKIILLKPFNGLAQTAFLMYKKLIVGKITPET